MRVFISWSGSQSCAIAEKLRTWIQLVIQSVEPYFSPEDINRGVRWSSDIACELASCRIGLLCMTRDNLAAPWLLFEAGALSKDLENSRVCPILFGLTPAELDGPLVQFQAAEFDEDGMYYVIKTINASLEKPLPDEVLQKSFTNWWPQLRDDITPILETTTENATPRRSDRAILEEILALTRGVHSQSDPDDVVLHYDDLKKRVKLLPRHFDVLVTSLLENEVCPHVREELFRMHKAIQRLFTPCDDYESSKYYTALQNTLGQIKTLCPSEEEEGDTDTNGTAGEFSEISAAANLAGMAALCFVMAAGEKSIKVLARASAH
jgi:hypothetical protein